jgi:hypothetical protein
MAAFEGELMAKRLLQIPLVMATLSASLTAEQLGAIEFFGYQGMDLAAVRHALTVHSGDSYTVETKDLVSRVVLKATGKPPTDIAAICCDAEGRRLLFIGLAGATSKPLTFNPVPSGSSRLPPEFVMLYQRVDRAIEAAVRKGGTAAEEDDSQGYALIKDPAARSLQLAARQWILKNEKKIYDVLAHSSDAAHRRIASDALGYGQQNPLQLEALLRASRDSDDEVRNNATRALGVLVKADERKAATVPPDFFIQMLNAGTWTDRNKGAALLLQLTVSRDPKLLAQIHAGAFDSLVEMASWRGLSHAYFARMVLGRVAGVAENQLGELASQGSAKQLLDAVRARR